MRALRARFGATASADRRSRRVRMRRGAGKAGLLPRRRGLPVPVAGVDEILERRFHHAAFVVELDSDSLLEDVLADYLAVALYRLDALTLIGEAAFEFNVGCVLIPEAAFQAAAHAGEARRIEGEALLARHLDRYRVEVAQPRRAAKLAAAGPDSAGDLGLVAGADLLHLDPHAQGIGEVADEFAEIHPAFGDEVEYYLAAVEGVFGVYQLHRQAPFADPFDAQAAGPLLLQEVVLLDIEIDGRRDAADALETRQVERGGGLVRFDHDGADTLSDFRFDKHTVAAAQVEISGEVIVEMAAWLEGDGGHFGKWPVSFERIDFARHLISSQSRRGVHPVLLGLQPRIRHRIHGIAGSQRAVHAGQDGIEGHSARKLGDPSRISGAV